jgi:hypothetical protein
MSGMPAVEKVGARTSVWVMLTATSVWAMLTAAASGSPAWNWSL